jgi:exopolyphosphatase/guanosine-5'-triphosphate,3'-diphosphate pyrophosphatase
MALLGAIDIGSNAIRLRIAEVLPPEIGAAGPRFFPFREVLADRASVRLGRDVFTKGALEPSVIAAACEVLKRFRVAMDAAKVERYRAVATSAAREAKNGELFVERAEREAGVHVEIIEGVEEARLVQLAVTERVALGDRTALLVDVGGGSTELTLLRGGKALFSRSLPVGTVRLIEAFLDGRGAVAPTHRALLDEYVDRVTGDALREIGALAEGGIDLMIGTGGNVETLAELCPAAPSIPPGGVAAPTEGRSIDVAKAAVLLADLSERTVDERIAAYALRPDRADTLIPAATVLSRIANAVGRPRIAAPGVGLKEGVLVDLARAHFLPNDFDVTSTAVVDACLRLGRRYRFDEAHGQLVARFAGRLFDDLAAHHRLGPRDRILLHAASLLHDVGDFVRYEGHHKHSQYIIAHSDLMGLGPEEREIVAHVARYHRKSVPSLDHETFRALSREARGKVKALAAILRIADALDREHRGKIADVSGKVEGNVFVLRLRGTGDRTLEEWTVLAKAGMLRDAFGLEVRVVDGEGEAAPGSEGRRHASTPPSSARQRG